MSSPSKTFADKGHVQMASIPYLLLAYVISSPHSQYIKPEEICRLQLASFSSLIAPLTTRPFHTEEKAFWILFHFSQSLFGLGARILFQTEKLSGQKSHKYPGPGCNILLFFISDHWKVYRANSKFDMIFPVFWRSTQNKGI